MHSFVISQENFKPTISPDTLVVTSETSVGIEEVRQLQSFLTRKPVQSEGNLVYIIDAHTLTVPAQNALLKTLEEPPGNSQIYLVTDYPDQLLPTVLSRVLINQNSSQSTKPDTKKSQELLSKLVRAKIAERLDILDTQSYTRDSLSKFLNDLEWITHHQINSQLKLGINFQAISKTRKYLQANCNLRLCINYFAHNLN